jgi:hypothetical protein
VKVGEKARNGHSLSIYSIEAEIWGTSAIELARMKRKPTSSGETDICTLSRAKETFADSCPVMSAKQALKHFLSVLAFRLTAPRQYVITATL